MNCCRFHFLRIGAIAAVCGLAGCSDPEERLVEQTFEKSFTVNPTARLTIRNADGAIRIYGSKTTQVKIQAIKRAYRADRVDKIIINATGQADSVDIDTTYPPRPKLSWSDRSGIVDYTIVVPETCTISRLELTNGEVQIEGMRGAAVTARLVNGRLYDHNGFGKHELFVANGGLDVSFDWWERGKFSVSAKIVNGNLRAFIPTDSSFHLMASAASGNITNDFGDEDQSPKGKVRKIDKYVGENAQPTIELQATEGNIEVIEANP
jgi:hypothetical protein